MELQTAVSLLGPIPSYASKPQQWADLGCGSGVFTQALATQLPEKSTVHAVDRTRTLSASALSIPGIQILEHTGNFEQNIPVDEALDGIVMANSLHFVKDQVHFLKKLKVLLKPDGRLLIVEYDTDRGNQWVPYPLSVETLKSTCKAAGFDHFELTTRVKSSFGHAQIYGAAVY